MVEGFLNDFWRDAFALAGIVITIVGFLVAINQIRRARTSAQQAQEAAARTRDALLKNLQLVDLNTAIGLIREVEGHIAGNRIDAANLRLTDLRRLLAEIKASDEHSAEVVLSFGERIAHIGSLQNAIDKSQADGTGIDAVRTFKVLRAVSDFLVSLAAIARLEVVSTLENGESDAGSN